jgi:hypothetical protein
MRTTLLAAVLGAALAAPVRADRVEDDLQVVRKAVASSSPIAQARPPAEEPAARAEGKTAPRKGEPRWFRVRIAEKAGKHARVSIDLPLGIARALGEEWPIAGPGQCRRDRCPTLGDVLRALDSGQSLVAIEDDEATVRVWVE